MKVYLAGPMTGYPLFNFPAFKEAREKLRAAGYEVICPAEEDEKDGFDPANPREITEDEYEAWMDRDMQLIKKCDCVVYLPGSHKSNGAMREICYAKSQMISRISLGEALANPIDDETGDALTATQIHISDVCDEVKDMLIEKNRAYGNSALEPIRVFSKADTQEQIRVRIDDKLSRLMRGSDAGEDVVLDLIGYLVLLRVAGKSNVHI